MRTLACTIVALVLIAPARPSVAWTVAKGAATPVSIQLDSGTITARDGKLSFLPTLEKPYPTMMFAPGFVSPRLLIQHIAGDTRKAWFPTIVGTETEKVAGQRATLLLPGDQRRRARLYQGARADACAAHLRPQQQLPRRTAGLHPLSRAGAAGDAPLAAGCGGSPAAPAAPGPPALLLIEAVV